MRQEFCEVATIEEAQVKCPWAAEIVEVDGGFTAFESIDDYNTWAGQSSDSVAVNAQDYVNSIEFPCFFFAGNGAPAGKTYAILENTQLPVDLDEVEGEIETDGGFICTNHDDGKGGWTHSDERGNTITKMQIYSDEVLWKKEQAEYESDC